MHMYMRVPGAPWQGRMGQGSPGCGGRWVLVVGSCQTETGLDPGTANEGGGGVWCGGVRRSRQLGSELVLRPKRESSMDMAGLGGVAWRAMLARRGWGVWSRHGWTDGWDGLDGEGGWNVKKKPRPGWHCALLAAHAAGCRCCCSCCSCCSCPQRLHFSVLEASRSMDVSNGRRGGAETFCHEMPQASPRAAESGRC